MSSYITLYMPDALLEAVNLAATARGVSRSAWIRAAVSLVLASQDHEQAAPERAEST